MTEMRLLGGLLSVSCEKRHLALGRVWVSKAWLWLICVASFFLSGFVRQTDVQVDRPWQTAVNWPEGSLGQCEGATFWGSPTGRHKWNQSKFFSKAHLHKCWVRSGGSMMDTVYSAFPLENSPVLSQWGSCQIRKANGSSQSTCV